MQYAHGPTQTAHHSHFVQFYQADEPALNRNLTAFLWNGLVRGDGVLVIATEERRRKVSSQLERLGADMGLVRGQQQLAMRDADETLDQFMRGGRPHFESFRKTIHRALQSARPQVPLAGFSAYGEMVGLLWERGQYESAIELEECWNRLLTRYEVKLFCGYPIDVFAPEFNSAGIDLLLRSHSHVLSASSNGRMPASLDSAMNHVLEARVDEVRLAMQAALSSKENLPEVESKILWLRDNLPEAAERILSLARTYFEASKPQEVMEAAAEGVSAAAM
jgi:hypothetical protein